MSGYKAKSRSGAITTDPADYDLDPDWIVDYKLTDDLRGIHWTVRSVNYRGDELGDTHEVMSLVIRK